MLPPSRSVDDAPALSRRIAGLRPAEDLVDRAALDAALRSMLGRSPAPLQIGRYVVLERIGAGGMGTVFAAWDRQLDRRIAVKVLHRGRSATADAAIAREARALARLADPNIVAVFDVGVGVDDADGPWLAMEYVDGVDLRRWLASTQRSVRERLDVLGQAALGLRAAHAIGVVHGDIKPENLLVDVHGRVRLVDFGLAREAAGRRRGGTPGYLAPEADDGGTIDAPSDLWALAVVAHELLVGRRPADTIARRPRGVSRTLWRTIVAGLDRDPTRRPDASAFVRAAAGEPTPVRAAWGLAALLGGFAWVVAEQRDAAPTCPEPVHVATLAADTRAAAGEHLAAAGPLGVDTWTRIEARLDAFSEGWSRERDAACALTVESAKARRLACLDARAAAFDLLVQRLAVADASTIERANQAMTSLGDPTRCADDTPDTSSGEALANLASARVLEELGDYGEALELADAALAAATRDDDRSLVAQALLRRGSARSRVGRDTEAADDLTEAYWSATSIGRDDVAALAGLRVLRVIGDRLDDPEAAARWAEPIRAAIARDGDAPEQRLVEHIELAVLARRHDREDEMRRHATRAVELAMGDDIDGKLRARAHELFAHALGGVPDVLGAATHHRIAVAVMEDSAGAWHPDTAVARAALAGVLSDLGDMDGALAEYERAVRVLEQPRAQPYAQLAVVLGNYANLLRLAGRLDDADARANQALAAYTRMGRAADHPDVVIARIDAALVALARGHHDDARTRLLAIRTDVAPDDGMMWLVEDSIGRVALAQHDFVEAERAFATTLALLEAEGAHDGLVGDALTELGEAKLGRGDVTGALEVLERAWSARTRVKTLDDEEAKTAFVLAQALWAAGERDRSRELAATARSIAARGDVVALVQRIDAWRSIR